MMGPSQLVQKKGGGGRHAEKVMGEVSKSLKKLKVFRKLMWAPGGLTCWETCPDVCVEK